jgi:hypothetical protein
MADPMDVERLVAFEKNITDFFTICGNIKRLVESKRVVSSKNIIYDAFDNFVEVYGKIGAEKTLPLFDEIYTQKRVSILSGNDSWLKNNCNIEYPRTRKTKRRYCIMASVYYRNANDISQQAQREIEEFNDDKNAENVFLPEEFTYPLLEIFLLVAPPSDIPKLTVYRDAIRSELKDTTFTPNTGQVPGLGNLGNLGNILSSALGGLNLEEMAKTMEGAMNGGASGSSESSGQSPEFNMENIGEAISGVLTNPKTKTVITKVMDSFKDIKNITDVQQKLGGILTDTELHQSLKDLVPTPEPISDREVTNMIEEAQTAHPSDDQREIMDAPGVTGETDDILVPMN